MMLYLPLLLFSVVRATELPVVDISPLLSPTADAKLKLKGYNDIAINEIGAACRKVGFFYIAQHGVDLQLQKEIETIAIEFFDLPDEEKLAISMEKGGKAWRGSFLVGDEVTSGIPDLKEGLYFGQELRVSQNESRPLHGPNLWPSGDLGRRMKPAVLTYMDEMSRLGSVLMGAIVSSLGVEASAFGRQFHDPTTLFRFFRYPPHDSTANEKSVGVGEHTDYGYLTILKQDQSGGLQAKVPVRGHGTPGSDDLDEVMWVDVPPLPDTFVVNLGDALQHNTGGLLLATTHRVQQRRNATSSRYSFPFFYDPSFSAHMQSVHELLSSDDKFLAARNREMLNRVHRWDLSDPARYTGSYGNYLVSKVAKVFPELALRVGLTGTASSGTHSVEEVSATGSV